MLPFEKPKTASELGLMQGFPPAADHVVTHENQLFGPYNRWSFQNELQLNRTVDVWRGPGQAAPLESDPVDLSHVTYQNRIGTQFRWDDMVEMSYTDGILVLHKGKVIYERYLNGMQPHHLHAWASGSKSLTGVLAAMLAHEGLLDLGQPVAAYIPELTQSGFGDATLRQVMDMTTAVKFAGNDIDPVTESVASGVAMGWRDLPRDYNGPANAYELLATMEKCGEHGVRFNYLTANTDVLAWVIKRITNQSLAQIMYERLWSRLGVQRDAFWIVGPTGVETAGSGLITTLPDMARFGQMLLKMGHFNDQQIVQATVVEDIQAGADPAVFARGPVAAPNNAGWSYHHQWWHTHNPHQAYFSMGYGGQMLYVDPAVQLVIAKFSSYPTPTPAGNEFYGMFAAFPVLAKTFE